MLCDKCKINAATIYLKQSINGKQFVYNLCEECSDKLDFSFDNVLKNVLDDINELDFFSNFNFQKQESYFDKKCPNCKTTFNEFKTKGKFGCANCYLTFKEEIKPILNSIQTSSEHIGKIPQKVDGKIKIKRKILSLKEKLQIAIKNEEYEIAANIRDKIKEIEQEGF